MRRALAVAIASACFLFLATKCQLLFEDPTPRTSCTSIGYPEPPAATDPGSDNDWTFALSTIDYGLDGGVAGFNLDQTCTCPSPSRCTGPDPKCDDSNGADNAGLKLLEFVNQIKPQSELNALLKAGGSGILLRVQRYNGQPNDPDVTVALYPATGLDGNGGVKNDGTDRWWIDRAAVKGNVVDVPVQATNKAWVANGMLVATFQNALVVLGGWLSQPPIQVSLAQAVITAAIDQHALTNGRLAGRVPEVDVAGNPNLLKAIDGFPDPYDTQAHLCGNSLTYAKIADIVCAARDISSVVNVGGTCDAMSAVIGFTASRANIAGIKDGIDGGHPCGASWDPKCP